MQLRSPFAMLQAKKKIQCVTILAELQWLPHSVADRLFGLCGDCRKVRITGSPEEQIKRKKIFNVHLILTHAQQSTGRKRKSVAACSFTS